MMRVCLKGTVCVCLFVNCSMESESSQTEEGFPLSLTVSQKFAVSHTRRANSISSGYLKFQSLFLELNLNLWSFWWKKSKSENIWSWGEYISYFELHTLNFFQEHVLLKVYACQALSSADKSSLPNIFFFFSQMQERVGVQSLSMT